MGDMQFGQCISCTTRVPTGSFCRTLAKPGGPLAAAHNQSQRQQSASMHASCCLQQALWHLFPAISLQLPQPLQHRLLSRLCVPTVSCASCPAACSAAHRPPPVLLPRSAACSHQRLGQSAAPRSAALQHTSVSEMTSKVQRCSQRMRPYTRPRPRARAVSLSLSLSLSQRAMQARMQCQERPCGKFVGSTSRVMACRDGDSREPQEVGVSGKAYEPGYGQQV